MGNSAIGGVLCRSREELVGAIQLVLAAGWADISPSVSYSGSSCSELLAIVGLEKKPRRWERCRPSKLISMANQYIDLVEGRLGNKARDEGLSIMIGNSSCDAISLENIVE